MIDRYNRIKKDKNFSYKEIKASIPKPSQNDYANGYINRYFIQRSNDLYSPIYEVDIYSYSNIKSNSLYTAVIIKWKLTGDIDEVKKINRNNIIFVGQTMPNLKNYLLNLTQFYKSII